MRHAEQQTPPTVAEVVTRAVELCYPDGSSEELDDFQRAYEDRDEPISALADRAREFFERAGRLEGQAEDPALAMAAAVATYLAFRRDEVSQDDAELLRLACRAEFGEHPPEAVADWMRDRGI